MKTYNIPLHKSFLNEVAIFIKNLKNSEFNIAEYTVFLPNRRSCRKLKLILFKIFDNQITDLPKIKAISDEFLFDDRKIALFVVDILKKNLKNKDISINTFFELAKSLVCLIKDLVQNDVDINKLQNIVPPHFLEYWNHTLYILHECMEHREIEKIVRAIKTQISLFINSISENHEKIIAAGIGDTNYYTRKFLESVFASENGITFFHKNDEKQSHNNEKHIVFSEFSNISEEAFAISIAAREAVFEKKSILIVTSDTALSTKIKSELLRWNIIADDSFGEKFSENRSGIIVSSIIDVINADFKTDDILNALKFNPDFSDFVLELELFFKKQNRVPQDFFEAFAFWKKNKKFVCKQKVLEKFKKLSVFANGFRSNNGKKRFADWFRLCIDLVELIDHESAESFKNIANPFIKHSDLLHEMTYEEFRIFVKNQVISSPIRTSKGYTNGITILGMIEAQLLDADVVIIAGANENSISSSEKNDFWMSRSMLNVLNIQTTDAKNEFIRCIFKRLIHKPTVFITRSKMASGTQQQPYSYLEKIIKDNDVKKGNLEKFVRSFHQNIKRQKIKFISPNPELCYRPNKFSATGIGLLTNNPYAFYAREILRLKKRDSINNAENIRGNFVHEVLDRAIKSNAELSLDKLNYIAENTLKDMWLDPSDFGIWYFRLKNIWSFFIKNIDEGVVSFSEKSGECRIDVSPNYSFRITCKADRIDLLKDETISIIDYKTGIIPSIKEIEHGYKPQLPIEAIIAQSDGFKIGKTKVSSLSFWSLKGKEKDSEIFFIPKKSENLEELIEKTLNGLRNLINKYNVIGVPYNINLDYKYDQEYMHLARVKEWNDA